MTILQAIIDSLNDTWTYSVPWVRKVVVASNLYVTEYWQSRPRKADLPFEHDPSLINGFDGTVLYGTAEDREGASLYYRRYEWIGRKRYFKSKLHAWVWRICHMFGGTMSDDEHQVYLYSKVCQAKISGSRLIKEWMEKTDHYARIPRTDWFEWLDTNASRQKLIKAACRRPFIEPPMETPIVPESEK